MILIQRNNAIISAASIIGVAMGALIGGEFISSFGRRNVIIYSNYLIIFFSLASIAP